MIILLSSSGNLIYSIDSHFIFIYISDANLARYGISPHELSKVCILGSFNPARFIIQELLKDSRVHSCVIFIASLVNEAEEMKRALPIGKAHIVLEPLVLPQIFKQVFADSFRND